MKKRARKKKEDSNAPRLSTNQKVLVAFIGTLVVLVIGASAIKDMRKEVPTTLVDISRHQKMLTEAAPLELMAYATELERYKAGSDVPGKLALIKKQLAVGERIEHLESKNAGTMSDQSQLARIGLIANMEGIHHQYELGAIDEDLTEYVQEQLENSNHSIRNLAHLTACFSKVSQYLRNQSVENFLEVQRQLDRSVDVLNKDPASLKKLMSTVRLLDPNQGNDEQRRQLYTNLGTKLSRSSNPEVREIGCEFLDYPVTAGFDFDDVAIKCYTDDPTAVEQGLLFVDRVAAGKKHGPGVYSLAIYLLELLEMQGNQQAVEDAKERLIASAAKIENEFVRAELMGVIDDYVKRSDLPGKNFDSTFEKSKIEVSKLKDNPVLVVFYDLTFNSRDTLESLRNLDHLYAQGLQLVCVYYIPDEDELLQNKIQSGFDEEKVQIAMDYAIHVSAAQAKEFLKTCPVMQGPYVILLNKDHVVEYVNVNPEQTRKLIEEKNLLEK